jgi:hypothetical protein
MESIYRMKANRSRKCRCGHTTGHAMVSAEGRYSILGWVGIQLGISVTPFVIHYRCRQCGQIVETTRDPVVLRQHY